MPSPELDLPEGGSHGINQEETLADIDDSGASTGFLWNPENSYSYVSAQDSRVDFNPSISRHGDFVSLITTISQAYQRDRYMDMQPLDDMGWTEFGRGSTFHVSKSNLELEVISPINNNNIPEKVVNKVVIKKTKGHSMTERDVRSFNRELRILDHFHGSENIVRLLGVGWFYNNDLGRPIQQPVLMLEEARCTLRDLSFPTRALRPSAMLKIFCDIAHGLSTLHTCGIVHGDITVNNVLLFHNRHYEESVLVMGYVAKLSDFGLAMFDTGSPQHRLGGTNIYLAPESGDALTFPELKQTDVYALGMLYAIVASGTEDILQLDAIRLIVEQGSSPENFVQTVMAQSDIDTEGSTFTPSMVELARSLFFMTLPVDPWDRSLHGLLLCFDAYYQSQRDPRHQVADHLTDPGLMDLSISYRKFMHLSGIVKDQITEGLLRIVSVGAADPRNAKALFELAVISISRFNSPKDSTSQGLQYLWLAAEHGDPRARALYGRLHRAYGCQMHPDYPLRRSEWLRSAAVAGYRISLDELAGINPAMASEALRQHAARQIEALFTGQPGHANAPEPNSQDMTVEVRRPHMDFRKFQVHMAAATGSTNALLHLLLISPELINEQNSFGDTPLLSACRYGQYDTATDLLKYFANASTSNKANENALHFLWRFETSQAQSLFGSLLEGGADPEEVATFSQYNEHWDLVPDLSGTPIERVASYGRLDLVKIFINQGCRIFPPNGNQLRRMLLLAIRLQHAAMQRFLIEYASERAEDFRADLRPLHKVGWDFKGQRRTYLDAAVLGWVRQTSSGIDVPVDFWQACYHGKARLDRMKTTIENVLHLDGNSAFDEDLLDSAILLSLKEKAYVAFEYMFGLKVLHTDGVHARLTSLRPFCWKGHGKPLQDQIRCDDSILGLPKLSVNYVDQVFNQPGTLAQQALLRGDRSLFHILVKGLGAGVTLPFTSHDSGNQKNAYAAVATSIHQDFWFVHELQRVNLQPCFPYESYVEAATDWEHPLYHSLAHSWWALSEWLIRNGASIFDDIGSDKNVLDGLLELDPLPHGLLEFLLLQDDEVKDIPWRIPARLETEGGYPAFVAVFNALNALGTRFDNETPAKLTRIWLALFEHYPKVENQPSYRNESVLGMTIELYRTFFNRTHPVISFALLIIPSLCTHITLADVGTTSVIISPTRRGENSRSQPIHTLIISSVMGSPLDVISLQDYRRSQLWKYRCFPSVRHSAITAKIKILLWVILAVGAQCLIAFFAYLLFWRHYWRKIPEFVLGGGLMFMMGLLMALAIFGIVLILIVLLRINLIMLHQIVLFVLGPGVISEEYFSLPEVVLRR